MKKDKKRLKRHVCRVCGIYGVTQIHHIFGGAYRRISEKHDLVIELCPDCHRKAHSNADFSYCLKHDAQLEWVEEHSMSEWMEMMHRSWVRPGEVFRRTRERSADREPPECFDDEEEEDGTCESDR